MTTKLVPAFRITRAVHDAIRDTIGQLPAEQGGVLGGRDGVGVAFNFDTGADRTGVTYTPGRKGYGQLARGWKRSGIDVMAFIHSHPHDSRQLSGPDRQMAADTLALTPRLQSFWLPIVMSAADNDGKFEIIPYYFSRPTRNDEPLIPQLADIEIVDAAALTDIGTSESAFNKMGWLDEGGGRPRKAEPPHPQDYWAFPPGIFPPEEIFVRIRDLINVPLMHMSRIMAIGCGGACHYYKALAQSAIGDFVLIDPDVVTRTNIATQDYDQRDVGRYKVEALRDKILAINHRARVIALHQKLDDLSDEDFGQLCEAPTLTNKHAVSLFGGHFAAQHTYAPFKTIITANTDDFWAQARAARLGLKFSLPMLAAQVYQAGVAAEIVFVDPDRTPACARCILRSRYDAQEAGIAESVGSVGTPICTTDFLNAAKTYITLALLHAGLDNARFGSEIDLLADRNLVQMKTSRACALKIFDSAQFTQPERFPLFSEAFLKVRPRGDCPDCGGTGHLRDAARRLSSTYFIFGNGKAA